MRKESSGRGGSNAVVVKFNSNGNFQGLTNPLNILQEQRWGQSIAIDANSNVLTTGNFNQSVCFGADTLKTNLWNDIFTIKLHNVTTGINKVESDNSKIAVYPNPASDFIKINVEINSNTDFIINIYIVMGSLVRSEYLRQIQQQVNISELSNGIYLLVIQSKDLKEEKKLIIQR